MASNGSNTALTEAQEEHRQSRGGCLSNVQSRGKRPPEESGRVREKCEYYQKEVVELWWYC
eukprot:676245-Pelagomonas_calceolata.AAC.2